MAGNPKVTRILHSRGLHRAKYDPLAGHGGPLWSRAWQRCRGLSTAPQSAYEIRNAWMAEGYAWHGLPARLGKATLTDALGDIQAGKPPRCRSRRPSGTRPWETVRSGTVSTRC